MIYTYIYLIIFFILFFSDASFSQEMIIKDSTKRTNIDFLNKTTKENEMNQGNIPTQDDDNPEIKNDKIICIILKDSNIITGCFRDTLNLSIIIYNDKGEFRIKYNDIAAIIAEKKYKPLGALITLCGLNMLGMILPFTNRNLDFFSQSLVLLPISILTTSFIFISPKEKQNFYNFVTDGKEPAENNNKLLLSESLFDDFTKSKFNISMGHYFSYHPFFSSAVKTFSIMKDKDRKLERAYQKNIRATYAIGKDREFGLSFSYPTKAINVTIEGGSIHNYIELNQKYSESSIDLIYMQYFSNFFNDKDFVFYLAAQTGFVSREYEMNARSFVNNILTDHFNSISKELCLNFSAGAGIEFYLFREISILFDGKYYISHNIKIPKIEFLNNSEESVFPGYFCFGINMGFHF